MDIGIGCAGIGQCIDTDFVTNSAKMAEEIGFSSYWVSEHPLLFREYNTPHDRDNFSFADPTLAFHDPMIVLTWAAAVTSKLRLGTAITLLPLRQPGIFAKEAASLDLLSKGRLALGIGSGWAEEEYSSVGLSFERRGARMVEHVKALRALWADGAGTFHGDFVNFDEAYCYPKPYDGNVPIYFGGESEISLKRVARLGDGWIPVRLFPDQVEEGLRKIRAYAEEFGRDISKHRVVAHLFLDTIELDHLKRFRDIGVDEFVIAAHGRLPTAPADLRGALEELAERFILPMQGS